MTLFYLALAYLVGVAAAMGLVDAGVIGCNVSPWWWVMPLALLPLTPFLPAARSDLTNAPSLRWPARAGFSPPRRGVHWALLVAMALSALMGALRLAAMPRVGCWTASDLAAWNLPADAAFDDSAPQVTVMGYVSNFPTVDDRRQEVVVTVRQVRHAQDASTAWQVVAGQARLTTAARPRLVYGQPVAVTGRLATPPDFEDFSYREVLARRGIHSHFYSPQVVVLDAPMAGAAWRRWLYGVRSRALTLIEQRLPEPQAALAEGILLGVDAGIPVGLYDRFSVTGTSHVLVISGSNVALIAALLLAVSRRVLGRWAVVTTLAGIAGYAVLVGADAAVLRAATMGGLVVVAAGVGRRSTALVSLAVACWAMLIANPQTLNDVGFQLSAAATLGLILFAAHITAWLTARWPGLQGGALTGSTGETGFGALLRGMVVDSAVMTVAATLLTQPLIAYHFGRVSALGLLVNLFVVPVQPVILVAGTVAILSGLAGLTWVAQGLLWVAWLGLTWTVQVVDWAATLPGVSVQIGQFGLGALLVTYGAIAVAYVASQRQARLDVGALHPNRITTPVGLATLAVVAALVWAAVLSLPDGRLHVYFLDIGQGDGILIQTPSGRQLLIDGGASQERLLTELGETMPWWDRQLDLILATHPDADHIAAQVAVPERYAVTYGLDTPAAQQDPDAAEWRAAVATEGAQLVTQHGGGWLDLGDGVALWVLWPPSAPLSGDDASNENSLVTKLVYGDFSVLLTGDAGIPSESTWLAAGMPLAATVLKVGHHGSANSTSSGLVEAVNPQWAVIQVGAENRYGHPTQAVLDVLAGRTVLRNDLNGRIHLATDGAAVWVTTQR